MKYLILGALSILAISCQSKQPKEAVDYNDLLHGLPIKAQTFHVGQDEWEIDLQKDKKWKPTWVGKKGDYITIEYKEQFNGH